MIAQRPPLTPGTSPAPRPAYDQAAADLIASLEADPWGRVRPSVYETARVLSFLPDLAGTAQRIDWLLDGQHPDGSFGEGPAPHRLLPTLSAAEALLRLLVVSPAPDLPLARTAAAVARALSVIPALAGAGPAPDTAAIQILIPELTARIDDLLASAGDHLPGSSGWPCARLGPLPGFDPALPRRVGAKAAARGALPFKLRHTFEGIARHCEGALVPAVTGLVGSSPAATAAAGALSPRPADRSAAVSLLSTIAARYGGLFPEAAPIRTFERLWSAAALARTGLPAAAADTALTWALADRHPEGVRGAPDLAPDADDTAMTVLLCAQLGQPWSPEALARFDNGAYYDCYLGEDTSSITANAHALHAWTHWLNTPDALGHPAARAAPIERLRDWLLGRQQPEGHWGDKWHASPYYATSRTVTALASIPRAPRIEAALQAAGRWMRDSQRADGSWGVWSGTAEETAYAASVILLAAGTAGPSPRMRTQLAAAARFLDEAGADPLHHHPALWHDKTLYAPQAMIDAEILATRETLRRLRIGPQTAY
ncbi:prenyltransferase/squalene oxidase repeat-containing protein [Chondromyces apiculatus]|uniref:Squalene cyclase C-terminal domain-containing protein n=1 Tax=Chondromyces apiculatus DSM 436 TaxID=1192034 RepID=A0A017T047_9BACT|nr:prenyltransferase/squalene oxidase repeat-containing protein [Chondromyces apiculatus]EYF02235.1 Hypothetical protein CAP_7307 [Chondromyces apiculatus DSM 436]